MNITKSVSKVKLSDKNELGRGQNLKTQFRDAFYLPEREIHRSFLDHLSDTVFQKDVKMIAANAKVSESLRSEQCTLVHAFLECIEYPPEKVK